jgi:hypothetical protein
MARHVTGMTMVGDHLIETAGNHAVRLRLPFTFQGLLGRLLGKLFGSITRQPIQQEAQALKQRAEATKG